MINVIAGEAHHHHHPDLLQNWADSAPIALITVHRPTQIIGLQSAQAPTDQRNWPSTDRATDDQQMWTICCRLTPLLHQR